MGLIMGHFGVTYNSTYNIGNNDIHSPAGFWLKVSSAQRWGLTQMFRYHASGAVNLVPPALHGTHLQSFNWIWMCFWMVSFWMMWMVLACCAMSALHVGSPLARPTIVRGAPYGWRRPDCSFCFPQRYSEALRNGWLLMYRKASKGRKSQRGALQSRVYEALRLWWQRRYGCIRANHKHNHHATDWLCRR